MERAEEDSNEPPRGLEQDLLGLAEELEERTARKFFSATRYVLTFFKWTVLATVVGVITGLISVLFRTGILYAGQWRMESPLWLCALPAGAVVICLLYRFAGINISLGTNVMIATITTDKRPPWPLAPLIFVSTIITHLVGGSAGREGAALQLGGCLGLAIGKVFRLRPGDLTVIMLCGMSGGFSGVFGAPLTSTFFAIEIACVGSMFYPALVPCLGSSLVAYGIAHLFGFEGLHYAIAAVPELGIWPATSTVILAALCSGVSVLFCAAVHYVPLWMEKLIPGVLLRAVLGSLALLVLTLLVGNMDYNGMGREQILAAMRGDARPEAFLLKILFTAITLGAGFKGGEIVPCFFVGATLGAVLGHLLGLPAGFGAALGLVTMFCGVVNCPVTSLVLSVELFGSGNLLLFAIACGVGYMLSGYYGLYRSQRIVYSKLNNETINIQAK
ncbi:MAG: chloride channel protein [Planctomycetia bacterium]|nr:chloride channel protein [Planctomycetia bacterium]